jgi:hypothetical protein
MEQEFSKSEGVFKEYVGRTLDQSEIYRLLKPESVGAFDNFCNLNFGCYVIDGVILVPNAEMKWKVLSYDDEVAKLSEIILKKIPRGSIYTLDGLIFYIASLMLYLRRLPEDGWLLNLYLDGENVQSSMPFYLTESIRWYVGEEIVRTKKSISTDKLTLLIVRNLMEILYNLKHGVS